MKPKTFDAVKMMRDIREKLRHKYADRPKKQNDALNKIRTQYAGKWPQPGKFDLRKASFPAIRKLTETIKGNLSDDIHSERDGR